MNTFKCSFDNYDDVLRVDDIITSGKSGLGVFIEIERLSTNSNECVFLNVNQLLELRAVLAERIKEIREINDTIKIGDTVRIKEVPIFLYRVSDMVELNGITYAELKSSVRGNLLANLYNLNDLIKAK